MDDIDLAFVGGGFRTTTFLASAPQLLGHRIRVYERGSAFGPGGFARYAITTTSIGSRFFKEVSPTGPYAGPATRPALAAVAGAAHPVPAQQLAAALGELGDAVERALGGHAVRRRSEVVSVHAGGRPGGVLVRTADGTTETCRHVVLATGRTERPHPELGPWRDKVLPSGSVISTVSRVAVKQWLALLDRRPVVIVGCSHSAMSALLVLLELIGEVGRDQPGRPLPPVRVLRRGPCRLAYDDVATARRQQVPGRERIFDPVADVCPVTGMVYRDSGLRHQSRELYCALWAGELPGAELVEAPTIAAAAGLLDAAGMVVQALGYHGRAPDIYLDGVLARAGDSPDRLRAAHDGALVLGGREHPAVSVLRVEPTPHDQRDNAAYGSDLYRHLARRLELLLGTPVTTGVPR